MYAMSLFTSMASDCAFCACALLHVASTAKQLKDFWTYGVQSNGCLDTNTLISK